jgi:glycosyltransferase involved in cell wall biosynthesis
MTCRLVRGRPLAPVGAPLRTVVVYTNERIGAVMAGPGIRSYNFAKELSHSFAVTVMARAGSDLDLNGVELVVAPDDPDTLARSLAPYDVTIAQLLPLPTMRRLARARSRVVYDLYNLFLAEPLASLALRRPTEAELLFAEWSNMARRFSLLTGSAFVCASERQRDFWLGVLASAGRVDADAYRRDPTLRGLIDVVPTGLSSERPRPAGRVLKGVHPGVADADRVLLWAGGVWNWLDPLTVIRAVAKLAARRDEVKLLFLGLNAPNRVDPELAMARRALELAESLGLRDHVVFFNEGWTPYDERDAYLLEADLGISAHFDILETRYAFRGRLLDHVWTGLPTVATRGDVLGELLAERGVARLVDYEDVDGWVDAIDAALATEDTRVGLDSAFAALRTELAWPALVPALARLVEASEPVESSWARDALAVAGDARMRLKTSLALGGARSLVRRQAEKLAGRRAPA